MQTILDQIEKRIHAFVDGDTSGHDIHHLKRVMNLALHLQQTEGGDRLVIAASALTHDVHRIIQTASGRFCHPRDSLPQVREILSATDFPADRIDNVLHCVAHHEEYAFSGQGQTVYDIETLILQDADNLDALGAIGIGRTFAFGGTHNVPLWEPDLPINSNPYDEETSLEDPSVIHHFHAKLLKLKDHMNTPTARRMAEARHQVMENFITEFMQEWEGVR